MNPDAQHLGLCHHDVLREGQQRGEAMRSSLGIGGGRGQRTPPGPAGSAPSWCSGTVGGTEALISCANLLFAGHFLGLRSHLRRAGSFPWGLKLGSGGSSLRAVSPNQEVGDCPPGSLRFQTPGSLQPRPLPSGSSAGNRHGWQCSAWECGVARVPRTPDAACAAVPWGD